MANTTQKNIPWGDGSQTDIALLAEWVGPGTVNIVVRENFGKRRTKTIAFYSNQTPKVANLDISQDGYTLSASAEDGLQLQWAFDDLTPKTITLRTNGTEIHTPKIEVLGTDASKFVISALTQVSTNLTESVYTFTIAPVEVNRNADAYSGTLSIAAGYNQAIKAQSFVLTQAGRTELRREYTNFVPTFIYLGYSDTIPAAGTSLTIQLQSVKCTLKKYMSDGTVDTEENVAYPDWDSYTWYMNLSLGEPSRLTVSNVASTKIGSTISFMVDVPSLGTTPYTNTSNNFTIAAWPDGKESADAEVIRQSWGGMIESNTSTSAPSITLLPTGAYNPGEDGYQDLSSLGTTSTLYIYGTLKNTWTSGESSETEVECVGVNSDTGIEDLEIPDSPANEAGVWATAVRTWPVLLDGKQYTTVRVTASKNGYYTRTFNVNMKVKE